MLNIKGKTVLNIFCQPSNCLHSSAQPSCCASQPWPQWRQQLWPDLHVECLQDPALEAGGSGDDSLQAHAVLLERLHHRRHAWALGLLHLTVTMTTSLRVTVRKIHPYFVGTSIVLLTYCIMNFINNWDSLLWAWIFTPFWVSFHFTKMFITQLNVSVVLWQDLSFLVNISLPGSKPGLSGSTTPLPGSALPLHLIKHLHSTCLNTCTLPVLIFHCFSLFNC